MAGLWRRYVGLEGSVDGDFEAQWRVRVFAYACLFCGLALLATVINHAAHGRPGTAGLLLTLATVIAVLPLGVRDASGLRRCGQVLTALVFMGLLGLSIVRGGLSSPLPMSLALVPLIAGVLLGEGAMLGWTIVVGATVVLMGIVPGMLGVDLVDDFDVPGQSFSRYFAPVLFLLTMAALVRMMLRLQRTAVEAARTAERDRLEAERAVEQQRTQQMAMVGQLAMGVAHEVNNPLSYVVSNIEFATGALRQSDPDRWAEVIEALADAADGGRRIGRIVTQLNAHGRIAEDKVGPVRLQECVDTALRMANNQLRHRARVQREFLDDPIVEADPHRLTQVFLNLLINATHAIAAGHRDENLVTVVVRCTDRGEAVVEVADTGVGIDPKVLPRITEPFFTTKREGLGTGLGLSISSTIIERFGGGLAIDSELGKGTCVRVTFPTSTGARRASVEDQPIRLHPHAQRILVIDDEPPVRRGLARMLPGQVFEAGNVAEALTMIDGDPPYDAIICDVMMPDATGVDFYRKLQRDYPHLLSRLILITGGIFDSDTGEFLQEQEATVLSKPLARQDLLDALREILPLGVPNEGDRVRLASQ